MHKPSRQRRDPTAVAYRSTLFDAPHLSIEQAQALMSLRVGLLGASAASSSAATHSTAKHSGQASGGSVEAISTQTDSSTSETATGAGSRSAPRGRWSFVRSRRWTEVPQEQEGGSATRASELLLSPSSDVQTKTLRLRSSTTYGLPFALPLVDLTVTLPTERRVLLVQRQSRRRSGRYAEPTARQRSGPNAGAANDDSDVAGGDPAQAEDDAATDVGTIDAGLYTDDDEEDDVQHAHGDAEEWEVAGWEDRQPWDQWLDRQAERGTLVGGM